MAWSCWRKGNVCLIRLPLIRLPLLGTGFPVKLLRGVRVLPWERRRLPCCVRALLAEEQAGRLRFQGRPGGPEFGCARWPRQKRETRKTGGIAKVF